MSKEFHDLAKDAGNKLKEYILAYSTGATGVFFLALIGKVDHSFTLFQKIELIVALIAFVATTFICLLELHIDARRFFYVAKQLALPEAKQQWEKNETYKFIRVVLIYGSYITALVGTCASVIFLIDRIS